METSERISKLLEYSGLSVNKFSEKIGVKTSQSIRDLLSGRTKGISHSVEDKILSCFTEIDRVWLLTGEGSMLKSDIYNKDEVKAVKPENDDEIRYVRLLPLHAQGGSLNDFTVSVKDSDCEKVLSPVKGADFAIQVQGDSMAPEYPSGSMILIKKINESAFIEWGKVYVLDTENGSVVKKVVPSDKDGFVRCVSINPDPSYAPFDVPLRSVYGIYRVLMCMSMK